MAALTGLYQSIGKGARAEVEAKRRELHRAVCRVMGVQEDGPDDDVGPGQADAEALKVAVAVVTDGPNVLLVRPRNSIGDMSWQFPAGVVKPGIDATIVAVEETLAETGANCTVRERLGARLHPVTRVRCEYFLCDYIGGTVENRDAVENVSATWVRRDMLTSFIPADRTFRPILEVLALVDAPRQAGVSAAVR